MNAITDILSVRLRNRAQLLRMAASGEWVMTARELRLEVRAIAAELERDAEKAMALEIKRGGSL
jgi:hypothetical protein